MTWNLDDLHKGTTERKKVEVWPVWVCKVKKQMGAGRIRMK